MKLFKNKKGASVDNFWVMVSFFVLVIFFIGVLLFWNSVSGLDSDLWDRSSAGGEIKENTQNFINTFDFILIITYFGIHLGILGFAYLLRTHPVLMGISIVLLAILALVAVPLSNAWEDIKAEDEISVVVSDIPMADFILTQLPKFEILWGFLTIIVMFSFARGDLG